MTPFFTFPGLLMWTVHSSEVETKADFVRLAG